MFLTAKLIILISLFGFIISRIDMGEMAAVISTADINYLTLTFAIIFINFLINTYLWDYLLQVQAIRIPYLRLAAIFFMGIFYSNFIPSGIGGSLVGAYKTSQYSKEGIKSTVAIFFSKYLAVLSLMILAFISLLIFENDFFGIYLNHFIFLLGMALLASILLYNENVMKHLLTWKYIKRRKGLLNLLDRVHQSFGLVRDNKKKVAVALGIALIFQIIGVFSDYCAALSLGITLKLKVFFLIMPLIRFTALVPVTFNGLGVREGSIVLLFSKFGLNTSQAFSMALIPLFCYLVLSLLGGGLVLGEKYWGEDWLQKESEYPQDNEGMSNSV
jgi:uncharacterized protein (TIRG00374 family)